MSERPLQVIDSFLVFRLHFFAVLVAHVYDQDTLQVGLGNVQYLFTLVLAEHDDLVLVDVVVRQQHLEILNALHAVGAGDLLQLLT